MYSQHRPDQVAATGKVEMCWDEGLENQEVSQLLLVGLFVVVDEAVEVDCFSSHWPTSPMTSSFVSISHSPSVAMTTKSPFSGAILVVVMTAVLIVRVSHLLCFLRAHR